MHGPAGDRDWTRSDREAFWTLVRVQMTLRRLRQVDVAGAIGLDRAALSRRLSGEIRERPTHWMLDQLIAVLKLSAADAEHLRQLAGCTAAERDADQDPTAPLVKTVEASLGEQAVGELHVADRRWIVLDGKILVTIALVPVAGSSAGALRVSVDVVDRGTSPNVVEAPNGVHPPTFSPTTQP